LNNHYQQYLSLYLIEDVPTTTKVNIQQQNICRDLSHESQVLLKVPRNHNLYTFDLNDVKQEGDLACLVAKASLDESTKWHRRMAHVNFKVINKLAKDGLVFGLPSKIFTN
jgi:hypothetical protein